MAIIPEFEATIEKLVFGGKGLARHESGKVVFVTGDCLPRERVHLRVFKKNKDYLEARVVERLSDSSMRIKPKCSYFGKCGGCTLQNVVYKNQLAIKQEYVEETLKKIFKDDLDLSSIIESPEEWRYRHKLELTFFAEKDGAVSFGFYYKGTWFKVINISDCFLFDERIKKIIEVVRSWLEKNNLHAFHHKNFTGLLRNLIIRHAKSTDEWMFGVVTTDEKFNKKIFDQLIDELKNIVAIKSFYWRVIKVKRAKKESFKDYLVYGDEYITEKLAELNYQIRFEDFFQNNVEQATKMVEYVIEKLKKYNPKSILDLYCGVGTFTLPLAKHLQSKVTGVEIVQTAIDSAKKNAKLNSLEKIDFLCKDVSDIIDDILVENRFDAIVVDPPRAGLSKKVVEGLINSNVETIVYVSCNPSTFARDLKMLSDKYKIESIQPFDLFPQTYHVECIGVLKSK